MPARDSCLALDLSCTMMGWACDGRGNAPVYGRVKLPGIGKLKAPQLGRLYAATRNAIDELVEEHQPARLLFCQAQWIERQTAARALQGVQSIAELVAYDRDIGCFEAIESSVRKAVTGKGSFGGKDEFGRLIEGLGRKQAKAWVGAWCARKGYDPQSDDEADALVLWHFDVLQRDERRRAVVPAWRAAA
jgi:Holliday junction resolvasome RuvABC endonuclease subunit